jgi:putative toxin-antitoxin system antitoxin component (TIGR02293 family)
MAPTVREARPKALTDLRRFQQIRVSGPPLKHDYVVFLGLTSFDTSSLIRRIQEGLSFAALRRFQENIELPTGQLADLVQISRRTLSRRKEAGRLQPDESDRLVRLSRVFAEAIELFEIKVTEGDLAPGWSSFPAPYELKRVGDDWLESGPSPVLRVPSAVVPYSWDYLLNPQHPDFPSIRLGDPVSLELDRRLG